MKHTITATGHGNDGEAALRSLLAAALKAEVKTVTPPTKNPKMKREVDYRALQAKGVEARRRKIHKNAATSCEDCGSDLLIGDGIGEHCPKCDGGAK